MSKTPNPQIDFGYFAAIPRSIRTEYKTLTPTQKWLYVCLKDLCGDHGTCYRALRTLSDETDISTGMLSESVQVLHAAGLIHAEKKKRQAGGKEVWHITIVDIWQANGKVHPSKRSDAEQKRSQNEQTTANVQYVNENVHCVNDKAKVCSHIERECSLCETEERTVKQEHTEAIPLKENISLSSSLNAQIDAVEISDDMPLLAVSPLAAPATRLKSESSAGLSPEQKTRARAIKAKIEDRCGVLSSAGPNIAENKAIAKLVQKYAEADIDDVEHYLQHCHFKWSKPDFKFKIRGNVIQDEMEPTLKLFAENPKLRDATKPETSSRPAQQEGIKYRKLPPIPTMPIRQPAGVN
jgi:hypothetical protein